MEEARVHRAVLLGIDWQNEAAGKSETETQSLPPDQLASQPMNTEKTNGESTPPAITSFSPARSGASSPRK
jgi:hypothetical protein